MKSKTTYLKTHLGTFSFLLLSGCAFLPPPQHVAFHQDTVLGFDLAVSPETQNVKVAVAYDRNTIAFVPVTDMEQSSTSAGETTSSDERPEAMSVIGLTKVKVPWFGHQSVTENIATGHAARQIAESPEAMAILLKAQGSSNPQSGN